MTAGAVGGPNRQKPLEVDLSPDHLLQLLLHRKWVAIAVFAVVSSATFIIAHRLPNIFTSETVILVDPQKVPADYVKPTVTGDVRNRLGTLSQQILSATRLQKIIETFNLYVEERKKLAREDVISLMRTNITVSMVTGGSAQQDLQSFKIAYSGKEPRLVSQVTNQLAALFIEENLKAREQQATGTTEFLQNQLEETRKTLESQEAKLRDFKMKHLGEMPENQFATLQVLGQLQSTLQQQSDGLSRAEQQRGILQALMGQSVPVVDVDAGENDTDIKPTSAGEKTASSGERKASKTSTISEDKAKLAALLARYTDKHPDVRKLKKQIADKEAAEVRAAPVPAPATTESASTTPELQVPAPPERGPQVPIRSNNPVLQSQLKTIEAEIAKYKEEQQRLHKLIATYRSRLEAIPLREQQVTDLVRDYETSKRHYGQLLDKQLSAETATQLEIRQKGERFSILDPAQPAQRPSKPNRQLINAAGTLGGLMLGMLLAIGPQIFSMSIITPEHITHRNVQVLEVIPLIMTEASRNRRRKQMIMAAISGVGATVTLCALLFYRYNR